MRAKSLVPFAALLAPVFLVLVPPLVARFGLSEDAATALIEATLAYSSFERRELDREYGEPVEGLDEAEAAVLSALERTSGHAAAQQLLVELLASLEPAETLAVAGRVSATVARLPEAGRVAYELGSQLDGAPRARFLGVAFARLGEHPAILDAVARGALTFDLQAGCYGLAVKRLLATPDTGEDVLAYFAQQWLKALLDAGLAAEARTAFSGLPAALRTRLASRKGGSGALTVDGLTVDSVGWDLAPALVAAALLTDKGEEARRRLAAVQAAQELLPETAPEDYDEREEWERQRETAIVWRLLELLATAGLSADPFGDLTRQVVIEQEGGASAGIVGWDTLRRAFARLAEREGYPEIADYYLRRVRRHAEQTHEREEWADPAWDPVPVLPIAVAARVAEAARQLEALRSELEDRSGGSVVGGDAAARTIASSLAAPRLKPYEERPLPAGIRPVDPESEELTDETSGETPIRLPGGLHPVRVERSGDEVVAVAVSQDYDPVGEVSAGGYWVVRSHDGGQAWSRPLYTGLRIMSPYVVRSVSELPLVGEGDVLHVEVEILELDEGSITLPPLGMQAKRQQQGLYLTIPFAELERDGDGDGLTDLAEERLLTDRNDPDTDGDGLGDAADPLPHVAHAGGGDRRARALEAVLAKTAGERWRALLVGPPGDNSPVYRPGMLTLTAEETLFVTGDRTIFEPLSPGRRVIVLTPGEEEEAAEKFGLLFTLEITLLTFDRSGDHGLVVWTSHWQGGTFRLDWQDGEWVAEDVTWWIT